MKYNVKLVILNFVYRSIKNKNGIEFDVVPDDKKDFVREFLNKYYEAFVTLFKDENFATKIFIERLNEISAIRFDDKDQNLMPLKFAFDDMKKTRNGKLDGGLFMPMYGDGVILLDMDNMQNQQGQKEFEATHTLIHELTHGMSMFEVKDNDGKKHWQIGVNHKENKMAYKMNEGFTEYISRILWVKMYPQIGCPGIGRYEDNVVAVTKLLEQMNDKDQILEDYLICGESVLNHLKLYEDDKQNDLYNFIMSFNDKDMCDVQNQKDLINGIKNFNYILTEDYFQ